EPIISLALMMTAIHTQNVCLGDSKGLLRNCRSYINSEGVVQDGEAESRQESQKQVDYDSKTDWRI
ncbi:MAG: hypothetical protein QGI86_26265, partial [Candidatus Poribacteria bacterium]|nr:hypothetical protein [Candidatus Poribacteria bacterium]